MCKKAINRHRFGNLGIVALLANLVFVVLLTILALCVIVWIRSDNEEKMATNSLLKHRQKRELHSEIFPDLPDASSAHAHEQKLKLEQAPKISPDFLKFRLITSIERDHPYYHLSTNESIRKPHPLLGALTGKISDAKSLYDTVKTDPELVAKILNVSNSPLFGLSRPIVNVHHAIVYLGVIQVKNIATHFALQKSLSFSDPRQQETYQKIWAASFLASSITLIIAKAMQLENAAELSTRCQLSYLGDISTLFSSPETAQLYSKDTSYFDRLEYTQELTKANSAILTGVLVKKWNLPKEIFDSLHNSALPFTNQISDSSLNNTLIQEILICYCCCRIAESIIYEGSNDIISAPALTFEATNKEEFYYLPKLLDQYQLGSLNRVFADANTKMKLHEAANLTAQKLAF